MLRRLQERYHTALVSTDWQMLKDRVSGAISQLPGYVHAVFLRGDDMVGWLDLNGRDSDGDTKPLYAGFDVDFDTPPDDLATALATELREMTSAYPADAAIFCKTQRPAMSGMVELWGGEILNRVERYQLRWDRIDHALIDRWRADGVAANPGLRMLTFETVPDEMAERFYELWAAFFEEMPRESETDRSFRYDLEEHRRMEALRQEQGTVMLTTALIDETGRMIGHSNVLFVRAAPSVAYQAMTGVDAAYRGRGLAKWLKAELLSQLGRKYPAIHALSTEMRAVNEPILAINRRLGHELEAQGHEMEIKVSAVRDYTARYAGE